MESLFEQIEPCKKSGVAEEIPFRKRGQQPGIKNTSVILNSASYNLQHKPRRF